MENQFTERLQKIEAVLDEWLPQEPDSKWLEKVFGQINVSPELIASLTRPGRDLVKRGGKRWRPLLMVLTAEAVAGEAGFPAALPLTPLVEFPHNASLIHDDIEDNSAERRGKPAVHLIYGTDTAINSGSFLFFLPMACLKAWGRPPGAIEQIWTAWGNHMRAIHLGQAMDIAWHRDFHSLPGLDEYDRMCRLKTGCLASMAAVLGVYSAQAGAAGTAGAAGQLANAGELAEIFGKAAEQLGVGFQILDDVKNLKTGVPGKKRGDDIVEGKKSLPVLLYLHRYPEKRDFAARCFNAARTGGTGVSEVEEMISALTKAGVLDEAAKMGLDYIKNAREVFSTPLAAGVPLNEKACELLAGLINSLG